MRRREVIGFLGTVGLWSFAARAQQPSKMKRLAVVHPATKPEDMRIGGDPNYAIIFEEMKRLGYVEGQNQIVDRYSAEGRIDRFPEIARDVVGARPDVIFAVANTLVLALHFGNAYSSDRRLDRRSGDPRDCLESGATWWQRHRREY